MVRYPEEVFPELRRLLEVAVERAPELRAEAARIDEQEGRAMTETARANSFVSLSGRLLGGYEQRFRLDSVEGQDRTDGEPVATIDAGLWWQKPLFAWGNLERYAQLGELGVKASELNFAEAARVHLNEVRSTFIQWQLAEAQLRLLEENVAVAVRVVEAQAAPERDVVEVPHRADAERAPERGRHGRVLGNAGGEVALHRLHRRFLAEPAQAVAQEKVLGGAGGLAGLQRDGRVALGAGGVGELADGVERRHR
ncbi:MAG: TolC family protein, partial [Opitutales bacterium]